MADPYLVKSLVNLRDEVNRKWPNRSTASDGWLGDEAHRDRPSDHNPDWLGRVHALDITASGVDPLEILAKAIKHPSTEYVIYNGHIYSRSYQFRRREYTGDNPHRTHLHISVSHTWVGRNSSQAWLPTPWLLPDGILLGKDNWKERIWNGSENALAARHVRLVQGDLGILKTGRMGAFTAYRVKKAQERVGLKPTGIVGPEYWKRRGI